MMTVAALIRPLVARPAVRKSDEDCARKREKKGRWEGDGEKGMARGGARARGAAGGGRERREGAREGEGRKEGGERRKMISGRRIPPP